MLLENIRKDLQGKAFLLSGLLAPLFWLHFSVGQICVIVLVFCNTNTNTALMSARCEIYTAVRDSGTVSLQENSLLYIILIIHLKNIIQINLLDMQYK